METEAFDVVAHGAHRRRRRGAGEARPDHYYCVLGAVPRSDETDLVEVGRPLVLDPPVGDVGVEIERHGSCSGGTGIHPSVNSSGTELNPATKPTAAIAAVRRNTRLRSGLSMPSVWNRLHTPW